MNYLQDIIIGILLLFGLVSGFISGGIKKGLRVFVNLGIFCALYYALKDLAVDYLRYDALAAITQGKGLQIQLDPTLTIQISNFEDLFILFQNADANLTAVQLKATCEVLFTVIVFVAFLLVTEIVSFPITFILYHLIFKFIFMKVGKNKKPKAFGRIIGGVFGVAEVLIFTYFWAISFGQFGSLLNEATLIIQAIPAESRGQLNQILDILSKSTEALNYEKSIILSNLINVIANTGVDPFALVSVTIEGSNEKITLPKAIQGIHDVAFDSIVEFIQNTFANSGSDTVTPPAGEEVVKLYNLGFNF